ncbi:MAG: chemotaxis protein CheW [Desulfovibrio sp.]|nr:chemotaxis protein CheW [Desulfovibrio sp.]MBI4959718.1 chemotaxis protein CheW [Desulfovibrio sp.]
MLFVTFKASGTRFALPARSVDEITPLVALNLLPGAPDYLAGLMNHRGKSLPVADMSLLFTGKASRPWTSTRIMIVQAAPGLMLGLMAERVLKAMELDPDSITPPGAPSAPYVLGVATAGDELVQVIEIEKIIPSDLIESLKAALEAA